MDESDEALLKRVAAGDENAFATLVGRHLDALFNYARRLSRSSSYAEDLVQETWLAIWQKASTYRPGKVKPTTWMHTILHNKFVDHARSTKKKVELAHVDSEPEAATTSPHEALSQREFQTLSRALGELPVNQRAALYLKHAQGFANADVARIMRMSVRAVESLQARGRRNLRSRLIDLDESDAAPGSTNTGKR